MNSVMTEKVTENDGKVLTGKVTEYDGKEGASGPPFPHSYAIYGFSVNFSFSSCWLHPLITKGNRGEVR